MGPFDCCVSRGKCQASNANPWEECDVDAHIVCRDARQWMNSTSAVVPEGAVDGGDFSLADFQPVGYRSVVTRASGSRTVKQLPLPGSLSTEIVPPWASTAILQKANPSPVLALRVVLIMSGWRNFSKICR
jgi:hypothetical protein